MQKTIIIGLQGSGKSTLCALLDGHPELHASYQHERFVNLIPNGIKTLRGKSVKRGSRELTGTPSFNLVLKNEEFQVRFSDFRKVLQDFTYYPVLETDALHGQTLSVSDNNLKTGAQYNLDFSGFEDLWKDKLFNSRGSFTAEKVIEILYTSLFTAFGYDEKRVVKNNDILIFCVAEYGYLLDFIMREYSEYKIIFTYRKILDFASTYVERCLSQGLSRASSESQLLNSNRLVGAQNCINQWQKLSQENPSKFMMLSLEDIVLTYPETMRSVAEFLNIDFSPVLLKASLQGRHEPQIANGLGNIEGSYGNNFFSKKLKEEILKRSHPYNSKNLKYSLGNLGLRKKIIKNIFKPIKQLFLPGKNS
jgi:hypothetical protein